MKYLIVSVILSSCLIAQDTLITTQGYNHIGKYTDSIKKTIEFNNSELSMKKNDIDSAVLFEQQRMANAAEQTVQWARLQFWVSIFGIIGLMGTLIFTGIATRSASQATKATLEGLRLSGRGHLGIKKFTFHRATWATASEPEVKGFYIVPSIANAGNAPVIVTGTVISTRVVKDGNISMVDWNDTLKVPETNIHILPQTEVDQNRLELNLISLSKIFNDEIRVLYMFKLNYKDIFNWDTSYHTNSCFELKVYGDPTIIFTDKNLSPSQYIVMEARGEFGSAS